MKLRDSRLLPAEPNRPAVTDGVCPEGWLSLGKAPPAGAVGGIVLDGGAAEYGLISAKALTQLELRFEVKLDAKAVFVARLHHQDRNDPASNSYHLACTPTQDYIAKHLLIFRQLRLERETWLSMALRRTEHSRIELMVNEVLVSSFFDNQLQSGFCAPGTSRGRIELRQVRPGDFAERAVSAGISAPMRATAIGFDKLSG